MPRGFLNSTPNWQTRNHFLLCAAQEPRDTITSFFFFLSVKIGIDPKETPGENWKCRVCQDFRMAPLTAKYALGVI